MVTPPRLLKFLVGVATAALVFGQPAAAGAGNSSVSFLLDANMTTAWPPTTVAAFASAAQHINTTVAAADDASVWNSSAATPTTASAAASSAATFAVAQQPGSSAVGAAAANGTATTAPVVASSAGSGFGGGSLDGSEGNETTAPSSGSNGGSSSSSAWPVVTVSPTADDKETANGTNQTALYAAATTFAVQGQAFSASGAPSAATTAATAPSWPWSSDDGANTSETWAMTTAAGGAATMTVGGDGASSSLSTAAAATAADTTAAPGGDAAANATAPSWPWSGDEGPNASETPATTAAADGAATTTVGGVGAFSSQSTAAAATADTTAARGGDAAANATAPSWPWSGDEGSNASETPATIAAADGAATATVGGNGASSPQSTAAAATANTTASSGGDVAARTTADISTVSVMVTPPPTEFRAGTMAEAVTVNVTATAVAASATAPLGDGGVGGDANKSSTGGVRMSLFAVETPSLTAAVSDAPDSGATFNGSMVVLLTSPVDSTAAAAAAGASADFTSTTRTVAASVASTQSASAVGHMETTTSGEPGEELSWAERDGNVCNCHFEPDHWWYLWYMGLFGFAGFMGHVAAVVAVWRFRRRRDDKAARRRMMKEFLAAQRAEQEFLEAEQEKAAPVKKSTGNPNKRPWRCPGCESLNTRWRIRCYACGAPRVFIAEPPKEAHPWSCDVTPVQVMVHRRHPETSGDGGSPVARFASGSSPSSISSGKGARPPAGDRGASRLSRVALRADRPPPPPNAAYPPMTPASPARRLGA